MRTNIVLDDRLVKEAMKLSRARTKREVVDMALHSLIDRMKRQDMKALFGKVKWEGDLKAMREA